MARITTVFWDVGGVLLTNGWPRESRRHAAQRFGLSWEEFESRHESVMHAFETGKIGLTEYLEHAVFYKPRPFSQEDFKNFILDQSQPYPETLAVLGRMAESKQYLLCTLNPTFSTHR